MTRQRDFLHKCLLALGAASIALLSPAAADAATFKVLYYFKGGSDGHYPNASLIADDSGNLYGTTYFGGAANAGTVFKLAPDGTETLLHVFTGYPTDGALPQANLTSDGEGNLFGTTRGGGAPISWGTIFKLTPDGTETVLYNFAGGSDGAYPYAGLTADAAGNLYGTTYYGGGTGCTNNYGCGTVFRLAPDGTESVLHAFAGGNDGANPAAGVILDSAGNLYGTTIGGGAGCSGYGCGIVFKIAPDGIETILHTFTGYPTDGSGPWGGLIKDKVGNLYGTTYVGGSGSSRCYEGCGTVYELAPNGTETVLYAFTDGLDGGLPVASLIRDKKGNLYGTTEVGGAGGAGVVFKLTPGGAEHALHAFFKKNGQLPLAGLMADGAGNLYGTTAYGGNKACRRLGCGTVFEVTP